MEQKLGFLLGETYNINISDIRADQLTTKAQVIFYVTDKVCIVYVLFIFMYLDFIFIIFDIF